jgi:hypothetical protein
LETVHCVKECRGTEVQLFVTPIITEAGVKPVSAERSTQMEGTLHEKEAQNVYNSERDEVIHR